MLTITRTYAENGEQVFSEPFPVGSLCQVWVGDTCTVYMPGDEAALAEFRASLQAAEAADTLTPELIESMQPPEPDPQ